MLGRQHWDKPAVEVILDEGVNGGGRRHFVRAVVTRSADGQYHASATGAQGSGILTSMVRANALVVIPEDSAQVKAGQKLRALMLDWPEEVF
jgi:molybdopterin molybdotransferase